MIIGYDGKRAAKNLTGLGNYSRWLISALAQRFPNNRYLVYASATKDSPRINQFFSFFGITLRKPARPSLFWRSSGIIRDLKSDGVQLFHGLSHELPFGIQRTGIKSVVSMHDLIFLRYPEHYNLVDRMIYRWKSQRACRVADRIIAVSQRTKDDIVALYNIDPEKIKVIYQSCDSSFKLPAGDEQKRTVAKKYGLPEGYILYVGTIESRKNLLALVRAFAGLGDQHTLVVVGRKTAYYTIVARAIKQYELAGRVIILENIVFADLPAVYQNARVFVLPSYYEGFGIPVIEALHSGVPVIAATGSCLEEAGGPASIYVHPDDTDALQNALERVMTDELLRANMISSGLEYVKKFDSEKLTDQMHNVYQQLLK